MNKPTPERIAELRAKVNGVVNLKPGFGLSTGDLTDLLAILASYEAALPLLEAAAGARLFPAPTDGRTCIDGHDKIIRAALAYRERSGQPKGKEPTP